MGLECIFLGRLNLAKQTKLCVCTRTVKQVGMDVWNLYFLNSSEYRNSVLHIFSLIVHMKNIFFWKKNSQFSPLITVWIMPCRGRKILESELHCHHRVMYGIHRMIMRLFVIRWSGGSRANHFEELVRRQPQKRFQITCEAVNIAFSSRFANDVLVVVIAQASRQLLVIHLGLVLANAPTLRNLQRIAF